jgi:large subunit ribosomal protein L13
MKDEIVIDGKDLILGRVCTYVAKRALLGYKIGVVNVDKILVTGNRSVVFGKYKNMHEKGGPVYGPFIQKSAQGIFKRALKRMLPFKHERGRLAYERVKAYKGVPARFKEINLETLGFANVVKVPNTKYVTLQEIAKFLGGK